MTNGDPDVQFVAAGRVTLAYRESGLSSGPAMILLNGHAETSAFFWRALISHFADRYRIIAFDLPGFGDSKPIKRGYKNAMIARTVAVAMTALHATPAVVVGHSLGGIVATRLALDWPDWVNKLVIYDSPLPEGFFGTLIRMLRVVPLRGLLPLAPLMLPGFALLLPLLPREFLMRSLFRMWRVPIDQSQLQPGHIAQSLRHSPRALVEYVRVTAGRENLIGALPRLQTPTLLIYGDSDMLTPVPEVQRYAALIPNAQVKIVANAGHVSLLDRPDEFNRAPDEFLMR